MAPKWTHSRGLNASRSDPFGIATSRNVSAFGCLSGLLNELGVVPRTANEGLLHIDPAKLPKLVKTTSARGRLLRAE